MKRKHTGEGKTLTDKQRLRKTETLVRQIRKAQAIAAELDCVLGNGGLADALLGSMADDLDMLVRIQKVTEREAR